MKVYCKSVDIFFGHLQKVPKPFKTRPFKRSSISIIDAACIGPEINKHTLFVESTSFFLHTAGWITWRVFRWPLQRTGDEPRVVYKRNLKSIFITHSNILTWENYEGIENITVDLNNKFNCFVETLHWVPDNSIWKSTMFAVCVITVCVLRQPRSQQRPTVNCQKNKNKLHQQLYF